ncbi:MAG: luxQ4 [Labilithrix sp.]|nr:luxQ4 [Labilithrix sp.]
MSARETILTRLSRELALACDDHGVITFADARALSHVPDAVGRTLESLCEPAAAPSVRALLAEASSCAVRGWELPLAFGGRPTTVCFAAARNGDETVLVGAIVPDAQVTAVTGLAHSSAELAGMHREAQHHRQELAGRTEALSRTLVELHESNSGLLALHGELDEKNHAIRRDSDVKARVVANVSHEFRTPINSILGITQLLLDRLDGDLTPEQEKQLRYVRTSAECLSVLVNDLLDLARVEAGKTQLRPEKIAVVDLLTSLRGMMRPLVTNERVELVVDTSAVPGLPQLDTDAGKVAQILRNLVSNALKFTTSGEVRVTARSAADGFVSFAVADTGIGIAPEDHARIFEDFIQVDSEQQRRVRGTGLGLSLSRKLAQVLGGRLTVASRLGEGSVFTLEIPAVHEEVREMVAIEQKAEHLDPARTPVLVLEDDRKTLFLYERYLSRSGFQVLPARTTEEARAVLRRTKPAAIVFDVMLEGETTWQLVEEIKKNPDTADIPLMVVTVVDRSEKARAVGADEFWLKPVDGERLIRKLADLARRGPMTKVLVIDDDEAARYLIRRLLEGTDYKVIETGDAAEGVELARALHPHVILLDFVLDNATAFDVIDGLKSHPDTRHIPIVIQTSKRLDGDERARLSTEASSILSKAHLSREVAIGRIRDALVAAGVATVTPVARPAHQSDNAPLAGADR